MTTTANEPSIAQAWDIFDTIERIAAHSLVGSLLEPLRASVAANLGLAATDRPATASSDPDARVPICVDFAEQFVVDVAGTSSAQRNAMTSAMGAESFAFVQVLYVADAFTRARIARSRIFGEPMPAGALDAVPEAGDLWATLETFMQTVALLHGLDPLTTEIVRLRGARVHNCRLCQSRRSVKAIDVAGGDDVFDAIDDYEHREMTERHRVALRLTDAIVTQPRTIDDALVGSLHQHFTDDEINEIVLDVVRNAANKIAVAFGGDAPVVSEGVEFYDIDASGEVVADVAIDVVRAATG